MLGFKDILDTLHCGTSQQNVTAITHGEMIEVARVILERMLSEEW